MHFEPEDDMATTSIHIDRTAQERLKKIADKEQSSLRGVVNELLDRNEQEEFRRAVHESFGRLRNDPVAWTEYREEVAVWDATLMDGLEDEPPFDVDDTGIR
jgi:hypothetical protein